MRYFGEVTRRAPAPFNGIWFVRCRGCLSIATVEHEGRPPEAVCSLCEGKIEILGHTDSARRSTLVRDVAAPACDGRCTGARGPNCDCQCGGKNHGTGRIVIVEVATEGGSLPRVRMPDTPKARKISADWTAALERFEEAWSRRYGAIFARKARGEWIPNWGEYLDGQDFRRAMQHAARLRTPAGRLRSIQATISSLEERPQ